MSRNDNFVPFSNHASVTSESEYGMTDPFTQNPSSRGRYPPNRTDYWFGKKYFECIIAQGIFEESDNNDTIEAADSLFEEVLRTYPFRETVNQLRSEVAQSIGSSHLSESASDYTTLMTFLGMTVRLGEHYDKRKTLQVIRNFKGKEVEDSDESPATNGSKAARTKFKAESPLSDSFSFIDDTDGPSIDVYTSRLKEIGDRQGWRPEYKGGRYLKDPSLFQTTVSFDGNILEGQPARNTKLAKHRASKAACDFLDSQQRHQDKMSDL